VFLPSCSLCSLTVPPHINVLRLFHYVQSLLVALKCSYVATLPASLRSLFYSLRSYISCVHSLRSFSYWSLRSMYSALSLRSIAAHIHCVHICSLTIRCAHCSLYVRSIAHISLRSMFAHVFAIRCAHACLNSLRSSKYWSLSLLTLMSLRSFVSMY
jgi:hypothetical protein